MGELFKEWQVCSTELNNQKYRRSASLEPLFESDDDEVDERAVRVDAASRCTYGHYTTPVDGTRAWSVPIYLFYSASVGDIASRRSHPNRPASPTVLVEWLTDPAEPGHKTGVFRDDAYGWMARTSSRYDGSWRIRQSRQRLLVLTLHRYPTRHCLSRSGLCVSCGFFASPSVIENTCIQLNEHIHPYTWCPTGFRGVVPFAWMRVINVWNS